ncbi:unnamed protein product [Hermetia illucens]|uniref:Kinetochore protein SPC25 n=1 Tax=Hermetia illucens TaxID=343691 RepID=A0A7R8YUY2_HERIL|nr:uncharacterized protein LOC119656039 [Hermetia illucens]CAD7086677.1 unnamed protein product [Hermetia illucens]
MSRLDASRHCLTKLETPIGYKTVGLDIKTILGDAEKNFNDIVESDQELKKNENLIEELLEEESRLDEVVRRNIEEICKMKHGIQNLEISLNLQKEEIDGRKKDYEFLTQELKHSASIETTLGHTMMNHLGVRLKLIPLNLETWDVMFFFDDNKFVQFSYNVLDRLFELQAIEPPHSAFETLQKFLNDTEDVSGLLYALRKHHFSKKSDSNNSKIRNIY